MLRIFFTPLFLSVSPLPEPILYSHPPMLVCRELATHIGCIHLWSWTFGGMTDLCCCQRQGIPDQSIPLCPSLFSPNRIFYQLQHSTTWTCEAGKATEVFITIVQWEKTSEHFLGTLHTIILHFQYCLAIVPSKSQERQYKQHYFSETVYSH